MRGSLVFQSGYFGLKHNDDWIDEILHKQGSPAGQRQYARAVGRHEAAGDGGAGADAPSASDCAGQATAGVDVELRQSLWVFIQRLTIVLTTHYLEEAETLCNRIAMLKAGRVIALERQGPLLGQGSARRDIMLQLDRPACRQRWSLVAAPRGQQGVAAAGRHRPIGRGVGPGAGGRARVRDFEVVELDLEQVFVARMQGKEA